MPDCLARSRALSLATLLFLVTGHLGAEEPSDLVPPPPPPEVEPALVVGILPDRTGGPDSGLAILERAVSELAALSPDLVINIGDMVQGYTYSPELWQEEAKEYKRIVSGLGVPWRPTAGNHDTFPGGRDSSDHTNEELYRRTFAPLWYSYDVRDVHFVHLYSDVELTSAPSFGEEQIQWLAADLEATRATSIFVFLHKPAWAYPGQVWEPIHQILARHPVKAVIAGHYHAYMKCEPRDGIAYYIIGAAGGHLHKPEPGGGFHHTCVLTIRKESWKLAIVKVGGIEADDFVLREDYVRVDANGSYRNRDLWVAGSIPEPPVLAVTGGGTSGEVLVHLANRADEPVPMRVTVDEALSPGWTLDRPIEVTLGPGEDLEEQAALTYRRSNATLGGALPATLLVHFLVTDSRGRLVDDTRKLRVPLERHARLGEGESLPLRLENWHPDYQEQADDPVPTGALAIEGDRMVLELTFEDRLHAFFPGQQPGGQVLSDAVEVQLGDASVLAFLFAGDALESSVWRREGKGVPVPAGESARLTTSVDSASDEWHMRLDIDLDAFGASSADALPFNLIVSDNDMTGFTDTYEWVRPRAAEREPRGTLIIER